MIRNQSGLKRIVVPVPLNREFKIPLRQAAYFHDLYGASITVLHVVHEIPLFKRWLSPRLRRRNSEKAMQRLRNMVTECFKGKPIPDHMEFEVVTGDLIPSILKVAEEKSADLIIIKKARRIKDRKQPFKKENADRLVSNSSCPVLTLHKEPETYEINRILLPVDITKKTDNKVAWAKSLAKKFGAEIHVVSVQNMDIHRAHSLSYQKGRRIENDIRKDGIKVEMILLKKGDRPMEEVVLGYAKEYRPDLLLIMTHQENILFDNYLGSFAREIIHKARVPVFSVVPRKETLMTELIDAMAEMTSTNKESSK
ncbi:MAG: universal stress protein [Bacteroidales bacterium]|nr:universal stress protein [Bacteroidales bacterium]